MISDDLVSSSLKTKKHYNSFNPNLGFFVPLDEADDVSSMRDECPSVRNRCVLSSRTSTRVWASWRERLPVRFCSAYHMSGESSRIRVVPEFYAGIHLGGCSRQLTAINLQCLQVPVTHYSLFFSFPL